MKRSLILLVLSICLLFGFIFAGCDDIRRNIVDPNSSLNTGIEGVSKIIPVVGVGAEAGTAAGLPWAAIVLLSTNIGTAALGIYKNYRKEMIINEQEDLYIDTKITTKAIIDAVEDIGNLPASNGDTIGKIIKDKVAEKLKNKDYYVIGKAVITSLKGE